VQVTLDPVILDRFRTALGSVQVAERDRLLCAVSGGPDSLALLLLAQAVLPGKLVAATVDHQLRPEAADEARYVHSVCEALGVPHVILTPNATISGNIQSSARVARYGLLERAADTENCKYIATAHHADDQLETLLMRLARGSGVDGLSAIRARNGRVVRPLLEFSKADLIDICAQAAVQTVDDPSNANAAFDRVAMRNWLASTAHPFRTDRAGRTAAALAEAADALTWMTDELAEHRITREAGMVFCDAQDLPNALRRRLLLRCLETLDPDITTRGDAIDRLLIALTDMRTATIGNVKCTGGKQWQFSIARPRRT
jgi:tRNA(Ile)-lysidine synthase